MRTFYRAPRSIKPAGILTSCLRTKWHNRDKIAYASQKMAVRYLQMPIFLNGKRLDINQCRSPHYKSGETRRDSAKTYRSPAHRSAHRAGKKNLTGGNSNRAEVMGSERSRARGWLKRVYAVAPAVVKGLGRCRSVRWLQGQKQKATRYFRRTYLTGNDFPAPHSKTEICPLIPTRLNAIKFCPNQHYHADDQIKPS